MANKQAPLLNVEDAFRDKKLESLADQFEEIRNQKAELAEEMTAVETKIVDRMQELKVTTFRYADKVIEIKLGSTHVKLKTVTSDGVDPE